MKWLKDLEIRQRFLIFAIAVDHLFLACITLGNCARGETISASAFKKVIDRLMWAHLSPAD